MAAESLDLMLDDIANGYIQVHRTANYRIDKHTPVKFNDDRQQRIKAHRQRVQRERRNRLLFAGDPHHREGGAA